MCGNGSQAKNLNLTAAPPKIYEQETGKGNDIWSVSKEIYLIENWKKRKHFKEKEWRL